MKYKNWLKKLEYQKKYIRKTIKIFTDLYSGEDNGGLVFENEDKLFFKYTPACFRALGKKHREDIGLLSEDDILFREDEQYLNYLTDLQ